MATKCPFLTTCFQDHDGAIVMQLVIDRVQPQHFRSYWFIATNNLGTTELEINVEQGNNVPSTLLACMAKDQKLQ